MTLEQLEAQAEASLVKMETTVENGLAMIECIEALSPSTYLEIVENK